MKFYFGFIWVLNEPLLACANTTWKVFLGGDTPNKIIALLSPKHASQPPIFPLTNCQILSTLPLVLSPPSWIPQMLYNFFLFKWTFLSSTNLNL